MKRIAFGLSLLIVLFACSKTPVKPIPGHPKMTYRNFSDSVVLFNRSASFDLDGNGRKDIYFATQAVGAGQHVKRQWLAISSFYTNLPVNNDENIPVLYFNDPIPLNDFSGYAWYNASAIVLAQEIIDMSGLSYWEGMWRDASHRFIPVQLMKNNSYYNGWVEVSFDTLQEKIILHQSGVSEQPDQPVLAGK